MFYLEALPKFRLLSRVDSLLTIGDRHWQKLAATFDNTKSANSIPVTGGCLFMRGAYFWMGAYKRDVVVIMGAYIHAVVILCGCLLSRFYGSTS